MDHAETRAQTAAVPGAGRGPQEPAPAPSAAVPLGTLAQHLPVGIIVWLADEPGLLCNPKALQLLALTQDQLEGRAPPDPQRSVVHPDGSQFPTHTQPLAVAIASHSPVHNVLMGVRRTPDAGRTWLLAHADPQLAPDGSLAQVVCTLTDVSGTYHPPEEQDETALLQRTAALFQEREAFTQSILNSVPSEIVVLSRNGTIVAANEAWRRFADENRLPSGDLPRCTELGANYLAVCERSFEESTDGSLSPLEGINGVLEGRMNAYSHEYPCHSPDTQRWFLMQVTPFQGARIVGAVVSHTDITRRKLAEINQQASAAELRQAQQIAHLGSWHWQRDSQFVTASEELCHIFGRAALPATAREFAPLFAPASWDTIKAEVENTLRTGVGFKLDLQARRSEGASIWVDMRATPVLDGRQRITGLRGTVQDITDQKSAFMALFDVERHLAQALDAPAAGAPGEPA